MTGSRVSHTSLYSFLTGEVKKKQGLMTVPVVQYLKSLKLISLFSSLNPHTDDNTTKSLSSI